jgi:hypothetical protein
VIRLPATSLGLIVGHNQFLRHSFASQTRGEKPFRGAESGWAKMRERLPGVVESLVGTDSAQSESSVKKVKCRQQSLSQPLAGFAVTNQSGRQDGY